MNPIIKPNIKYLLAFTILLLIETVIALFVRDTIIRPYIGDILVVILMYTFVKGVVSRPLKYLPVYLFLFAAAVEIAQYFQIVDRLNLRGNNVIATMIGTSFDSKDILCYLIAAVVLILWEKLRKKG